MQDRILDGAGEFPDTFHNALYSALDGARYTLDGVSGVLTWHTALARYPYAHWTSTLSHCADGAGRESTEYGAMRARLGDDYDTDLSESDRLIDIAIDVLGLDRVEAIDRTYARVERRHMCPGTNGRAPQCATIFQCSYCGARERTQLNAAGLMVIGPHLLAR